jgi:hypothetical protein
MRLSRPALVVVAGSIALGIPATIAVGQVTTSQYDNMRTGATLNEKTSTERERRAVRKTGSAQRRRCSVRAAIVRVGCRDSGKRGT